MNRPPFTIALLTLPVLCGRGGWRWALWLLPLLAGCASLPPARQDNACALLESHPEWYESLRQSEKKWGIPVAVQMAIIRQESSFREDARPPRERVLWVIPWSRPTTAYGYAQALDSTWEWYRESTGNDGAQRDDFEDATDFIGWYCDQSHRRAGISRKDAYNLYLAYHEGHRGYLRKTHESKKWLLKVAGRVREQAAEYGTQLSRCDLPRSGGFSLWPF
ncbi:MAG: transglycosylase SLT domain-containing protein [Magnetococcus sp. WYHC-3]